MWTPISTVDFIVEVLSFDLVVEFPEEVRAAISLIVAGRDQLPATFAKDAPGATAL